jgi:hypothetical protein
MTQLAEGMSLKDGSTVLAKIASAHSNASMCIEREAHMSVSTSGCLWDTLVLTPLLSTRLERMAVNSNSSNVALRIIDFFSIPRANGDCVVLLLVHPGLNLLGRYFPPSKVNDLLLADMSRQRTPAVHGDAYMANAEEPLLVEDMEPMEVMDLASFLE